MIIKLKTYDDYELYCQYDEAKDARGVLVFSHGFVEYGAHYSAFAKYASSVGYSVLRYDERAHGRTTAPLGDLKAFQDYANDLDVCVSWVKNHTNLPVFTVGFSLGGMITLLYGLMYPYAVDGQVIMGSLTKPQVQFENINRESISIHEFLEYMGTSGDKGIQQLVTMDSPYILKNASLSFIKESMIEGPRFIQEHLDLYKYPILVIHGRKDPIVPVRHSESIYEKLGSDNKKLLVYEDGYHDLLRIKEYKNTVDDIIAWCDACIG